VTAVDGVLLDNSETLDTIRLNANDAYLMLLPQTIPARAVSMEVTWEVDGVGRNQTVSLPEQTWVPGKRYDYSIGVSLEKITLDPVVVNPWGTDDQYKPCTLTYKANGVAGEDIKEYRSTGVANPLFENTYTPPLYYTFGGWNTQADGGGDDYQPDELFMCEGNTILYANWLPPTINVETGEYPTDLPEIVTYANNVFTIVTNRTDYVVIGNTGAGASSNGNRVKVASGVTATVTLRDAVIDVSNSANACAFDVAGANATLVLDGVNTLKSGSGTPNGAGRAGLRVPNGGVITITSISGEGSNDGELTAIGYGGGSGIGGNGHEAAGTITISGGIVNAFGAVSGWSAGGAGIGGGGGWNGGTLTGGFVTITGGIVNANGSGGGAGIGGGGELDRTGGSGGTLIITGGKVTAKGGGGAVNGISAGIGGGGRNNVASLGSPTYYYGPGAPSQSDPSWEGWNDTNTAGVSASGQVAIDGVEYMP
jgi:hypothetical protein